jgi:hypothetical protein
MLINYTCDPVFGVFISVSKRILFRDLIDLGVSLFGTLNLNQSGSPKKKVQRPYYLQYPVSGVLWK